MRETHLELGERHKVMHPHQNLVCTIPPIKQNV